MNESCGNAKREETLFESIVRDLENSVAEAQSNSDTYGALIGRLDLFDLECDRPVKCESAVGGSDSPNTVTNKLKSLVSRLQYANRKNGEIIDNLKRLV